jgi:DNA polymerase III alpha subunit (gram-positive type)
MTFLAELTEVLANANNAMAGHFLRNHSKLAALVEAVQKEHGGDITNPKCPICIAINALNKEPK